jgi:hypothetical protein
MSKVWDRILALASTVESRFAATGELIPEQASIDGYDWYNKIYTGKTYRRAHVEIVDKREDFKILILHCTIFPHYTDPSPIWGFDAVCGANKITGAFHDVSSGGIPNHFMVEWFAEQSQALTWNKKRELPEWAAEIFSPYIIAAGNVSEDAELDMLTTLALTSLDYYLENVGKTAQDEIDYYPVQLKYNQNNKLNPHVKRSMISMGVPEPVITKFIDEVLYPEAR